MKHRAKKLLSILLTLALVLGLMPGVSLTAYAAEQKVTFTAGGTNNGITVSPTYYDSNSGAFFVKKPNDKVSISSSNYNITKLVLTDKKLYSGRWGDSYIGASAGNVSFSGDTMTVTGINAKTVTIQGGSNYATIGSIDVYYNTHTHNFTYSASGETITATCANTDGNCTLPESSSGANDHVATLTIGAPPHTAYGDGQSTAAVITDTNNIKGDAVVSYYSATKDGDTYSKSSNIALGSAPVNIGDYIAEITLGGATASVGYSITKGTNSNQQISATDLSDSITKTGTSITIGSTDANYEYVVVPKDTTPDWTGATTGTGNAMTFDGLSAGTGYDVYVRAKGNENYNPGEATKITVSTNVTVTISGTPAQGQGGISVTTTPEVTGDVTYRWYIGTNETSDGTGTTIVPSQGGGVLKVEVLLDGEVIGTATTGTTTVKTLAEVIESADNPVTITLNGPVKGGISIPAGKEVQLDIKGQEVGGGISVPATSTLTINDTSDPQTGTVKGTVSANTGTVIIKGGRYDSIPTATDPGTVTIEGGLFKTSPTVVSPYAVKESGNADYSYEVYSTYVALTDAKPTITLTKAEGNTETTPQVGDTLTATPSPANAKPVTYVWYRGNEVIEGAIGATYTVTADDVGKTIHAVAKQEANADGNGSAAVTSSASENTSTIEKKTNTAEQITTNALTSSVTKTGTAITVTPTSGYEYAVVTKGGDAPADSAWKSGTSALTFDNLDPGTEYDVLVRAKGDDTTGVAPGTATKITVSTNVSVTISGTPTQGQGVTVTLTPAKTGVTYKWYIGDSGTPDGEGTKVVPSTGGSKLKVEVYAGDPATLIGEVTTEANVKTLAEAISESTETPVAITLDGPVTGPITIPASKEVTLDLHGQTVTGGVVVDGKAVIKDSTGEGVINGGVTVNNGGKATITGGTINGGLNVEEGGTLTVTGGTFSDPNVLKYIDKNDENADVTIKLAENKAISGSPVTLDIKGKVTLDLNGHTLTGSVNVGENATLNINDSATGGKLTGDLTNNGVLNVVNGTFNGAITNAENAVMSIAIQKTGALNGGVTNNGSMKLSGGTVNGSGTVTNEEKGTLTVDGGEINVNIVNKGTATIEGGIFAAGKSVTTTTEKGKTTINGGTFKGSVSSTESGKTTVKGGQFDNKPTAETSGSVSIEGGKFKADPTASNEGVTTASGKQIFNVEGNDYPYQLGDKPETVADVKVDQGETTATVANTIADGDQAAAQNTAESTTADPEEAAVEHVKQIVASSTSVNDGTKNIVIVPALEVKTETYTISGADTTLTLNIEATYTSYETDGSITTAAGVKGSLTSQDGKATQIGSGKLDTKGTPVKVKFEVPADFANALSATTSNTSGDPVAVYVKHTHDGKNYEYNASLYYDGTATKYFVEFVNPNGFSPFTLSGSSEAVASVGGKNYTDLQSAIDEAPNGSTITLTNNDNVSAQLNAAKTVTIDKSGHTGTVTITAASTLNLTTTAKGEGKTEYKATVKSGDGGYSGGGSGGGSAASYPSTIGASAHGKVTASPASASSGTKVTLTVKPDAGYEVDTVTVTDAKGKSVAVTKNADGTFTFTQPSGKVTVNATFKPIGAKSTAEVFAPYSDLNAAQWYAEGIKYCLENGIMSGYGDGRFGPNDATSRAQLATILYNMEGKPAATGTTNFTDVKAGDWFADAIRWASAEGIVGGYGDGKFGPNDTLTRDQLVTILYRYAKLKGVDTSARADLSAFSDAANVSDWAKDAMQWAVAMGIINGMDGKLNAQGEASRAQIATIIMRYCENVAK